jgi:hypothetical protein
MNQIQEFLNALRVQDWSGSEGPMRLSHKLEAADYAHAQLPANVRILIERLDSEGGVPATSAGNLPRAFVEDVFECLQMSDAWRAVIRTDKKVMNEMDASALHRARVVAHAAGFLALRKKRFQTTQKGKKLLAPDRAGDFYRELFTGYFRRFNLSYDLIYHDLPEIQATLPAILWRMDAELRDWTPVAGLAPRILLPVVLQRLRDFETQYFKSDDFLVGYVHEPLRRMGLLEVEHGDSNPLGIGQKSRIKTSRLWRKFLWFDWQP